MYKQEYKMGMMKSSLQNRFNLDAPAFSREICNVSEKIHMTSIQK